MMGPRSEHRVATAASVGAGLGAVGLVVPMLTDGGLVGVLAAAAIGVLVGAPAAVAEWRTRDREPDRSGSRPLGPQAPELAAAVTGVAELAGLLLVANLLAELAHTGWFGAL